RIGRGSAHVREHLDDARAHALAQLGGGGLRERDDENLLHFELALEEEPQVDAADGPRLAGPGGRLDEIDSVERRIENVERGGRAHHVSRGSSMDASSGSKSVRAHSSNSASSGSSWPRSASRYAG